MDNRQIPTPNNSNTYVQNGRNPNTHVEPVNPNSVSYEDGYVHGRAVERSREEQRQEYRDEHTAARGLLLGIGLTSLVGLVVGTGFYLSQRQDSPTAAPVVVPVPNRPEQQNRETTIIERRTETTQQSAPTTDRETQPDIRVIIPNLGQQQSPSRQNTTPQSSPTEPQNPLKSEPPTIQPNTSTNGSTTTPSSTTNQSSSTPPKIQIPTVTTTTAPSNTTNQTSSEQTQNQTQSDSSDAGDTKSQSKE